NHAAAAETAGLIVEEGGEALALQVDATQQDQVRGMVAAAVEAYGQIDVLDNNVGIA
ncbi:MAG: SDR family NAD(P)-dependent oxidoreductase, partial [Desulfuromonadales bacterium]|nr:SDR family NAD(P)-dependent oxidoreductase [Desulfuromonadales bacterium]